MLLSILAITFIVYYPGIHNQLTNWDDDAYIYRNDLTKTPVSWQNAKRFCTQFAIGNYHPLTLISFHIDYVLYGLPPVIDPQSGTGNNSSLTVPGRDVYDGTGYHITSVVIHLFSVAFLFFFCIRFYRKFIAEKFVAGAATLTALLFAIHPMHVESVIWASERKDQLYAMFYHACMLVYIIYLDSPKRKYLFLVTLLFLLSLLSKGQAVTLPVTLLLITYAINLQKSKNQKTALLTILQSKKEIPFFVFWFIMSAIIGWVAVLAQRSNNSIHDTVIVSASEKISIFSYGLWQYIKMVVLPTGLSMFHPYPLITNGQYPATVYVSVLLIPAILGALWFLRKNALAFFGLLFFLIHIIPVSRIIPVGTALFCERYTYVAYTGLFMLMILGGLRLYEKSKPLTLFIAGAVLVVFAYESQQRCKIWHDNITLYENALEETPTLGIVNGLLGMAYFDLGKIPEAKKYLDLGISQGAEGPFYRATRAHIYVMQIDPRSSEKEKNALLDSAITDCNQALLHRVDSSNALEGMGICYGMKMNIHPSQENLDSAKKYLLQALTFHPINSAEICQNIGNAFNAIHQSDSALAWFNRGVANDSALWGLYLQRGMILYQKGEFAQARKDFDKSIANDASPVYSLYYRSLIDKQEGKYSAALQDAQKGAQLQPGVIPVNYIDSLKILNR